jgi:peptidoglycan hydrolase FlgJ
MALMNPYSGGLAIDGQSLAKLKLEANKTPDKALQGAAKQFESVFTNMLLKSMRATLPKEGLFDNESTELYTGMLDQQLAQQIGGKGLGLADMMVRQLTRGKGSEIGSPAGLTVNATQSTRAAETQRAGICATPVETKLASRGHSSADSAGAFGSPRAFADRLWNEAQQAEAATGVPAKFILGQAALESGWGKREIRSADGSSSFDLFAIKAGKGWTGKTLDVVTTEYVNGEPRKVTQKFRAYASYAEAFSDYARLLTKNPRYAHALEHGSDATHFAQSLQKAGYATDPRYAQKLAAVINSKALRAYTA